ncbi:hypothetical protein RRG08_025229 [Elysia crispata]|uniref:TIR domain-containing protein n=1 Tax=Elysia crispata TaxID=231223 RepID=A0AAE1DVN0_9GAST|nr:hypothetical protein RRG08_025229 [Elysia crispata]
MPASQTLKIKKTVQANHWNSYRAIVWTLLIFVLPPLLAVARFSESNGRQYGDVTNNLLQDVLESYPTPKPSFSLWVDHQVILSGISKHRYSYFDHLNNMETFMILFNWKMFSVVSFQLILYFFSTADFVMNIHAMEIAVNHLRYLIFFILSVGFSFLLVFATDGAGNITYQVIQNNILEWLESSVLHIGLKETGMEVYSVKELHPFTAGVTNPYFFEEHFRYIGEDVQFVCEYDVKGDPDVEPNFIRSWWNKNGSPVKISDRVVVNVTIQPTNISGNNFFPYGMRLFTIRNTLTINMIEQHDYGHYTCFYGNPIPMRIRVKPVFEKFEHSWETSSSPMSPSPQCDRQPQSSSQGETMSSHLSDFFAEFKLQPRRPNPQDLDVNVNVGGILITSFSYVTLADASDVSVEVTLLDISSTECCSVITKLYWIFFRGGGFVKLPQFRAAWSEDPNALGFTTWACICRTITKRHKATIYRKIFNSTLNLWEIVSIDHPASLVLHTTDNGSSFLQSLQFCDENNTFLCYFLDMILENRFYTVYSFDVVVLVFFVIYFGLIRVFHGWLKLYISIPTRKMCLRLFLDLPIQFEPVHGPQIKHLKRSDLPVKENNKPENVECQDYDIYISYIQESPFDRAVAEVFKKTLIDEGLMLFDPHSDILPGHPVLGSTQAAIHSSSRFVIFVSETYKEDHLKTLEFDAINDTIKSQGMNAKSRLLIVRLGQCQVDGLHRVPCISVPNTDMKSFQMDEFAIYRFKDWEKATRPVIKGESPTYCMWRDIRFYGYNWKTVVSLCLLGYLASHSFLFSSEENIIIPKEMTEIV